MHFSSTEMVTCMQKRHGKNGYGLPWWLSSKESAGDSGETGSIPGLGRSLEEGMATHFSILAWRIPWMEKPGKLHPRGCKECDRTEATEHASRQGCMWKPHSK